MAAGLKFGGEESMDPIYAGWLSIVPPIIAIALALMTKEVISSLMIGILSGTLIYACMSGGNPVVGTVDYAFKLMANRVDINIILFLALLGALVAVVNMAGGSQAYGRWAGNKLKSKRSAMVATGVLGSLIFIDDYFNCLTVGTVMKPVTDKYHISRAKLAYIIDATAAPICIIAPISSWAAAVGSNLAITGEFESDIAAFIATIPYNLYALLSILMVFLLCFVNLDFGPMEHAEEAAEAGDLGAIDKEETDAIPVNEKGRVFDMLIPILALIVFSILAMLYNGGFWGDDPAYHSIGAAFGNCVAAEALVLGGFAALVVAFLLFVPRRVVKFRDFMAGITMGVKSMVPAFIILTLAWTISGVCRDLLMTGDHLRRGGVPELLHGHRVGHLRHPDPDCRPHLCGDRAGASGGGALRDAGGQRVRRPLLPDFGYDHPVLHGRGLQPHPACIHAAPLLYCCGVLLLCRLSGGRTERRERLADARQRHSAPGGRTGGSPSSEHEEGESIKGERLLILWIIKYCDSKAAASVEFPRRPFLCRRRFPHKRYSGRRRCFTAAKRRCSSSANSLHLLRSPV